MAAQVRIDAARRLVITEVWDECTNADIERVYRQLRADPAFLPTFDQVLDLRRVRTFTAAGVNVRGAGAGVYAPGVKRAVIARPGFIYGMARMLASGAESQGHVVEIFDAPQAAERWLGRPPGTSGLL